MAPAARTLFGMLQEALVKAQDDPAAGALF
jgi:hypothetical protein